MKHRIKEIEYGNGKFEYRVERFIEGAWLLLVTRGTIEEARETIITLEGMTVKHERIVE